MFDFTCRVSQRVAWDSLRSAAGGTEVHTARTAVKTSLRDQIRYFYMYSSREVGLESTHVHLSLLHLMTLTHAMCAIQRESSKGEYQRSETAAPEDHGADY